MVVRSRLFAITLLYLINVAESSRFWHREVKPAQRMVSYGRTRRTILLQDGNQQGGRSQSMIHVDAYQESVDVHFQRIRNLVRGKTKFNNAPRPFLYGDNQTLEEFNVTDFNLTSGYDKDGNETGTYVYTASQSNDTQIEFHPIRIKAFLSNEDGAAHLSPEQHVMLMDDIVRPALLSWSTALRVKPVQGNLTVDPTQLLEGSFCGADGDEAKVKVPQFHLDQGIPDTDIVVYLHLAFTPEYINLTSHNATNSALGEALGTNPAEAEATTSILDEDNLGTDTMPKVPMNQCSGSYIGASSFCSTDQMDRPTAGLLTLCIGPDFFERRNLKANIMTVMHELAHLLGFNSQSLAYFRRPDGSPRTTRVDGRVPLTEVECTGPKMGRRNSTIALPSRAVLRFREARGLRVAEIVTPTVKLVVRNHFGCQKLTGAELESSDATECIGDHFERRLFKGDLMNPVIDELEFSPRFSTLLLAYFADSGWYQVDLSRAAHAASWGRGAGCEFVEGTCIQDGSVPEGMSSFFCNDIPTSMTNIHGCTNDISRKAGCLLGQYNHSLPIEYQYFNSTLGPTVGGNDAFLDYCPVYQGFPNGLCSDPENEALIRVNRIERFGYRNSRCLSGEQSTGKTALCLPIACIVEDRSFRLYIEGDWEVCKRKGQRIVAQSGDVVVCPDPVRICPTFFCENDCLGTGLICDYSIGQCVPDSDDEDETTSTDASSDPVAKRPENSRVYKPGDIQGVLPEEDSPLADYYVESERILVERMGSDSKLPFFDEGLWWKMSVLGVAMVSLIVAFFLQKGRRTEELTLDDDPDGDDPGEVEEPRNPEKDKAMAHVVVDIRMREQGYLREDPLVNRMSETDLSMTDTEGGRSNQLDSSFDVEDPSCSSVDVESEPECTIRHRRSTNNV